MINGGAWLLAGHLLAMSIGQALPQAAKSASAPLPPVQRPDPDKIPDDTSLPPYEPQLDRLAELMGTLAYLRELCGKTDASDWRAHMSALMEAEATTPIRKERLAGAYNRGFRGYENTYRACTPSAELVIVRFSAEGDRLARELVTRFGAG